MGKISEGENLYQAKYMVSPLVNALTLMKVFPNKQYYAEPF